MDQNNCDDYYGEWDGDEYNGWHKCQTAPSTKEPLDIVSNSKTGSFSKIELHIEELTTKVEELTSKVEELTSKVQDLSGQMSQPDVTLHWNTNGRIERHQIKYPNAQQNRHAW
jgi:predicted RNase H-like nuclease (RuvC/YqgF family)